MPHDFQADIDAVNRITAVPTILDVVCATTGMGFAAVARVTEDRWIACTVRDTIAFGLEPGGELEIETTICNEIREHREPVIIENVAEDETYCRHHTPATYGFQSYISMPILLPDGTFFGTLCAIDPAPRPLRTPVVLGMFKLFAELIAFHLNAHDRLTRSEAQLAVEIEASELREQFIAVLGHDLRNPLASIGSGVSILQREAQSEKSRRVLGMMQQSVARMGGLIGNLMDFARGRLGGGLTLDSDGDGDLVAILQQVTSELQTTFPDRRISLELAMTETVRCDSGRIAQLFSNLIANALSHGAPDQPIRARAATVGEEFVLSVANSGAPIPEEAQKRLFQPFFRAEIRPSQQGLGLGLFIVSEIARAHGGTIDVTSTAEETRFTLRMPLRSL
jgi:signal transduction histidine kinase